MDAPTPSASFDLNTASADSLCAKFPDLGLFCAEDIVVWREKNGPFRDKKPLVAELGISDDVASRLAEFILQAGPPALELGAEGDLFLGLDATAPSHAASDVEPRAYDSTPAVFEPTDSDAPEIQEPDVFGAEATSSGAPGATDPSEADGPAPKALDTSSEAGWFDAAGAEEEDSKPVFGDDSDAEDAPPAAPAESQSVYLPGSASQAADQRERDTPAPAGPSAETSTSEAAEQVFPKPARGLRANPLLLGLILVLNVGLVAGMFGLRLEERKARAPMAALSVDVKDLHAEQSETRAKLDETQIRLDKQAAELAKTAEVVAASVRRQKEADREAKEQALREARDIATLNARVNRIERTVEDSVYTVEEAVKIIDSVQLGRRPSVPPTKLAAPPAHGAAQAASPDDSSTTPTPATTKAPAEPASKHHAPKSSAPKAAPAHRTTHH